MLSTARRGIALTFGQDDAFLSSIWIDDAAEAVVAALDVRAPSGIYDVVDDEPLRWREVRAALAAAVGRRRLLRAGETPYRHQRRKRSERTTRPTPAQAMTFTPRRQWRSHGQFSSCFKARSSKK